MPTGQLSAKGVGPSGDDEPLCAGHGAGTGAAPGSASEMLAREAEPGAGQQCGQGPSEDVPAALGGWGWG